MTCLHAEKNIKFLIISWTCLALQTAVHSVHNVYTFTVVSPQNAGVVYTSWPFSVFVFSEINKLVTHQSF